MPILDFTLRLNTPAFAGAVQKGTRSIQIVKGPRGQERTVTAYPGWYPVDDFGIRIPSLRGVVEFWYRSLLGGKPHQELYEEQGRTFGSTTLGQGLSLRYAAPPIFRSGELAFEKPWNAFLYLGYGPLQLVKVPQRSDQPTPNLQSVSSHNEFGFRDAILVDGGGPEAEFRFVARGSAAQLRALERALILLHLFGGVGARSRRGWGSIRVEADFIPGDPSPAELDDVVRRLWQKVAVDAPKDVRPRFSAFGPGCLLYRTPPLRGDYREVLREFHKRFQVTRLWDPRGGIQTSRTAQADHDLEAQDAPPGRPLSDLPRRLAFGLPYSPESRRNRWAIEYVQESRLGGAGGGSGGRRASPLILKVQRLGGGQYVGFALLLNGTFLGDGTEKIGAVGKRETHPPPNDYEAIHEFLNPTEASPSRDQLRPWTHIPLPGIEESDR